MKPYIYKVTDKVTGEFYIGSQCSGKVIGKNYFTSSSNKTFKNKFKSNPAQFEIKIIGTFTEPISCVIQENIFIKSYIKNPLCLNKSYTISKERQFNMSGYSGRNSPNFGKHHSEETKKKIAESNKGKFVSKETKVKLSESHKGQIISAETRKKLSIAFKGRYVSEKTRKILSDLNKGEKNPRYGKPLSEEQKQRLSKIHKGKSISEEHKRKLSEFNKGKIILAETRKKISESLKNSPYYHSRRKVICVETQVIYNSITEAAISVNASSSHITECAKHQRKTIKGFHWEYAD